MAQLTGLCESPLLDDAGAYEGGSGFELANSLSDLQSPGMATRLFSFRIDIQHGNFPRHWHL